MIRMRSLDCDVVVIGSGFGGSVCAMRAAESGLRVTVLERGPRISTGELDAIGEGRFPLFHRRRSHGIVEVHRRKGLLAVTGSAVGGGSHVYTAVTVPAPPEIFEAGWPSGITREYLDPYYDRVFEVIAPSPIPIDLPRTQALEAAGKLLSAPCIRLPQAMDWTAPDRMSDPPIAAALRPQASVWLRGGAHSRKRTLDRTYLARAEEFGAEVRPLHEVTAIVPREGEGYSVEFTRWSPEGDLARGRISSRRVVLAAGTMSTLRLLFQCRDSIRSLPRVSECLGQKFSGNGDFGALIFSPGCGAKPDSGPPVTAWLDLWKSDRLFLMDTGVWPLGLGLSSIVSKLNAAWSIAVMGFDGNPSRVSVSRGGRLRVERDASLSAAFDQRRLDRLRQLAEALGGRLLAPPAWFDRRMPGTVHPMGGAAMANSMEEGVTNLHGEVFGHPGLFVADASLFPAPTGVAPSMTIAAVAEHVVAHIIREF